MNKKALCLTVILLLCFSVFASDISFSGGKTSIANKDGHRTITLTDNAHAETDNIELEADSIELSGENYIYVNCNGNVVTEEKENNITLKCPSLFFNREKNILLSEGWIEIDDIQNEAQLSGSHLEYNIDANLFLLQVQAELKKSMSNGLLTCTADSIEYNSKTQMLTLKGHAKAVWDDDTYSANMIVVNLDTEEINLYGSITGEVNG